MSETNSQQLASFYVSIFLMAVLAVWLFSASNTDRKNHRGRILCSATAKPEFQLAIDFSKQAYSPNKNGIKANTSAAAFKIIRLDQSKNLFCKKQLNHYVPIYLTKSEKQAITPLASIKLELILYPKLGLTGKSSYPVWRIKKPQLLTRP